MAAGDIIGERYRVVRPLARGGFGAVYEAEQLTTERRVALKILVRYADDVPIERLLAEAKVTSRLHSDHIVQVLDAGVDAPTSAVFVVMELLSGMTLEDWVVEHGTCTPADTGEYLRQVAAGLDKAHGYVDRGGRPTPIVHRDLKPSNVFLTQRDDGSPLIKILDFGAAKVLSSTTRTSGVIRGTPQYMAYEQVMGTSSSPATDVWAFGLIAFFLLTGRSYWLAVERDGTQVELFAEILNLPLPAASARARELGISLPLPPQFDAWFSRCVNREVSLRFRSAGLAAGELASALGLTAHPSRTTGPAAELPTLAHGALTSARGSTQGGRARAVLSTLGVVLIGAGGAAATFVWKGGGPTGAPPSPSARAAGASPAPSGPGAPTTPEASPSPNAAAVVSAIGAASAPSRAGATAGATSIKRPVRLPPAPSNDLPKPPIRDVYERR